VAKAAGRSASRRSGACRDPGEGAGIDHRRSRFRRWAADRQARGPRSRRTTPLALAGRDHSLGSRAGGVKLAFALDHFAIPVSSATRSISAPRPAVFTGRAAGEKAPPGSTQSMSDAASSPGNWRQDERVVVHEGLNARYLTRTAIAEPIDVITCDAKLHRPRDAVAGAAQARRREGPAGGAYQAAIRGRAQGGPARAAWCATPPCTRRFAAGSADWLDAQTRLGRDRHRREPDPGPPATANFSSTRGAKRKAMTTSIAFPGFRAGGAQLLQGAARAQRPGLVQAEEGGPTIRKSWRRSDSWSSRVGTALEEAGLPLVGDRSAAFSGSLRMCASRR